MTEQEFMEIGTDIFTDYLPKMKVSDRKAFLEALLEELVSRGVVDDVEAEGAEEDDPSIIQDNRSLFDPYGDD